MSDRPPDEPQDERPDEGLQSWGGVPLTPEQRARWKELGERLGALARDREGERVRRERGFSPDELPPPTSKREADRATLHDIPGARLYRMADGPLAGETAAGNADTYLYLWRAPGPDEAGRVRVRMIDAGAYRDENAAALRDLHHFPAVVGYYTLDAGAAPAPVWRWTANAGAQE